MIYHFNQNMKESEQLLNENNQEEEIQKEIKENKDNTEIKEKGDREINKDNLSINDNDPKENLIEKKEDKKNSIQFKRGNDYKVELFEKPAEKLEKFGNEINKLKISGKENVEINSGDENEDTSFEFSSFLKKINDISKKKQLYEEASKKLKIDFYKCKCCDCCGGFLDCFCCKCCHYEIWLLCGCCFCCKRSIIDIKPDETINIENYKNELNDFKDDEEKIIKTLEDLRIDYINTDGSNSEKRNNITKRQYFYYYFFFSLVSLIHFFLMAVIEAVIFALMREIFRDFHFKRYHEYEDFDKKDFEHYLKKSSKNDTSQINFNYLSSFITNFFVYKTNFVIAYILSNIAIIIIIALMFLFNFLDKEEILKGKNYEIFDFWF